jgi:hypothetical protein
MLMQRRWLFGALVAVTFFSLTSSDAAAQSVDVGVQYSLLRLRDLGTTDSGVGGRISFSINPGIAVEAELNYFPQDRRGPFESGRKTQALFGVKTGLRSDTAGVFGKIRPGFIHFSRDFDGLEVGKTNFALDIGGVIEFYPGSSSFVRFDVGDTIIRFGQQTTLFGPTGSFTSHNLQFSAGVGVRF